MKKYNAPALEMLSFNVNEDIAVSVGSLIPSGAENDGEFGENTWG